MSEPSSPIEVEAHACRAGRNMAETEAHGGFRWRDVPETEAHALRHRDVPETEGHAHLVLSFPPDTEAQTIELRYTPPAAPGELPEIELHAARAGR
jgi:hypothetical protein